MRKAADFIPGRTQENSVSFRILLGRLKLPTARVFHIAMRLCSCYFLLRFA